MKKNNAWKIRRLVDEVFVPSTHRPSKPAYYIEDCWILCLCPCVSHILLSTAVSNCRSLHMVAISWTAPWNVVLFRFLVNCKYQGFINIVKLLIRTTLWFFDPIVLLHCKCLHLISLVASVYHLSWLSICRMSYLERKIKFD